MKFDMNFNETPIEFLFKLIFSWTYAQYSSFILFLYTSYLFVYIEASVRWFYLEKSEENSFLDDQVENDMRIVTVMQ